MGRIFFWKKFNKRQSTIFNILLGVFLVVAIPVILAMLRHPESAKAAWLDDNWAY